MTFDGKAYTTVIDTKKVLRVLDVGTGTGIWAIDYGGYFVVVRILFEN
jgi:hypothetical protein